MFKGCNILSNIPKELIKSLNKDQLLELNEIKIIIFSNSSIVLFKLRKFKDSLLYAEKVLKIDPNNFKILYRKCKIYIEFKDYNEVEKCLEKCIEINKNFEKLNEIKQKITELKSKEKSLYKKVLENISFDEKEEKFHKKCKNLNECEKKIIIEKKSVF